MGQTLTHGIYLPDEGERNCYAGLAANWQLLDTSVGTIAEHTSQIAGKAPAVHTHTKSDITDFPALATVATSGSYNDLSNIPASFTPSSHTHGNLTNDGKVGTTANLPLITGTDGVIQAGSFGNAANTFCEGNDSRLSDARTPVAHTHGKADITDLLNSNFIPSANNSYDLGTSTNKWKTLNGINPGALSLPSKSYESINNQIYNPDNQLNNIDLNGGANYWISDCDCYIYFFINNNKFSWIKIYWPNSNVCLGQTYISIPNDTSAYSGYIPVPANTKVIIMIQGTAVPSFRRVTCQGNV